MGKSGKPKTSKQSYVLGNNDSQYYVTEGEAGRAVRYKQHEADIEYAAHNKAMKESGLADYEKEWERIKSENKGFDADYDLAMTDFAPKFEAAKQQYNKLFKQYNNGAYWDKVAHDHKKEILKNGKN